MTAFRRRAVFLDRDGVLNTPIIREARPYPPSCLAELQIPAETIAAAERLRLAGFVLIGVTNQPDVARGKTRREVVEEINAALRKAIPLQEMLVCYHDDADNCDCRKPKPGLILLGGSHHNIDLKSSFMVGDRWRDIAAGRSAGCRTVFIDLQYDERKPDPPADHTTDSFHHAVDWILAAARLSGGPS